MIAVDRWRCQIQSLWRQFVGMLPCAIHLCHQLCLESQGMIINVMEQYLHFFSRMLRD